MNKLIEAKSKTKTEMIAFLQDNLFMGFVESAGAEEIIRSARKAGFNVVDYGSYFNVEVMDISK